jgi:hypothetical protein
MKKFVIFLLLLPLSALMYAGKLSEQQALEKARQFMPGRLFDAYESTGAFSRGESAHTQYLYIFNVRDGKGFVIVSGDDRTEPILGYSMDGHIDDDMPLNLKEWLEYYALEIKSLSEDYQPVRVRAKTRSDMKAISPLIETTWNQGRPYNLMCPMDGENRCVTGCTATAQAQIMYHHKWPESSTAIPAYVTSEKKIPLDELPPTTFKWNKMKLQYNYDETGEAADAVAELMRYCGQSDKMNYTSGGSGANIILSAMISHFSYSKNMKRIYRNNYSCDHWESIIYQELAEGRPVQYVGFPIEGSGHAFVCDGYDGDGLFHLNWGWGGGSDGFFVLSVADPSSPGVEGKSSTKGFSESQHAIIGIRPGYQGEVEIPNIVASGLNFISQSYSRQSASENFENIVLREYISVSYNIEPTSTYDIEVGWGLYQNDVLKKAYSSGVKTAEARTYSSVLNEASLSFGKDLTDGIYSLQQIYRIPGTSEWILCPGYMSSGLVADIKGTSMTIRAVDTGNISFEVNKVSCSDYPQAGATVDVNANITNKGTNTSFKVCLWSQKKGSSMWTRVGYGSLYFSKEVTTQDITISYIPDEAGDYNLKLTSNFSDEALGTAEISISASEEVTLDGIIYSCSTSYRRAIILGAISNDLPKDVIIPSTVSASGVDCNVVSISNGVFRNMYNLTKVVVPEGVESIGMNAFYWCQSLQLIDLPSTIMSLGTNLIYGSNNLKAVVSHIKEPFEISDEVFGKLEWVDGVSTVQPSPATLYVPEGTLSKYQAISGWTRFAKIEEGEVKDVKVGDLNYRYSTSGSEASVIPGDYSELTDVTIPSSITVENKTYSVTAIEASAFQYCNKMQSITIEKGIKSIGNEAFYNCSSLKSVVIPEGVLSIGSNVFAYCYPLQKLELPSTLISIGKYLIKSCDNLATVISRIQDPMDIPDMTFMTEKYIDNQWTYFPSPATLYVPEGTLSKYQAISGWTQFAKIEEGELREVTVGDLNYSYSTGSKTATVLPGDYAEIESITVPESIDVDGVTYKVTAIANEAFRMDWNGKTSSVILPDGIVSIGNRAFMYVKFSQFQLPKALMRIGDEAFEDCSNLTTLTVPEGVVSIGNYAFYYCSSLKRLELPSSLTSLGERIINYCSNLIAVVSHIEDPFEIPVTTFASVKWVDNQQIVNPSPATLYVPFGTLQKYQAINGWTQFANMEEGELIEATVGGLNYLCATGTKTATVVQGDYSEMKSLNIPASVSVDGMTFSVTAVGNSAFYYCPNLTSISLPASLKTIGEYAFYYNKYIKKLSIPEGVESVGTYAFASWYYLETLELPSSLTEVGDFAISGNRSLTAVYSRMVSPISVSDNSFVNRRWDSDNQVYVIDSSPATLFVPEGSLSAYQSIVGWTMFAGMEEYAAYENIAIGAAKQVAYYSDKNLDFTNERNLKAYVATGYDKTTGTIWLSRVFDVPANTGFLLMGDADTYEIPVSTTGSSSYYKNMFKGTLTGTTINTTDGEYTNYYLSNGDDGVGFYKVTKEEGVKLGKNRAYLPIPTVIEAVGEAGSTVAISVGGAEQVPYYSDQSLDFTTMEAEGMKAYTATGYDYSTGTIWLSRVNQVPAETGILIMAPKGSYDVPTASVASVYENMFKGTLNGTTIYTEEDDFINYYLSNGTEGVGFYKVTKEGGVALGANRCYLQIPKVNPSAASRSADVSQVAADLNSYSIGTSDVIGIQLLGSTGGNGDGTTNLRKPVNAIGEPDVYYNLNGQRVDKPGKGIYIHNGRSVILR